MDMKLDLGRMLFLIMLLVFSVMAALAGNVKGNIADKLTKEALPGATVQVEGGIQGAVADMDGNYVLQLQPGTYTLVVRYVGYKDAKIERLKVGSGELLLDIAMESDAQALGEVAVTAQAKRNNEVALLQDQRRSLVVQSGVSAQQIARTQDKDASEVIKRVPGVSILDEKFVMVRGLSQRYNNVWLNGSAVPSSEADSRAFSFDILPSSQLENMVIVKSPAPEYPADFTGGFILINTQEIPGSNKLGISVGTGFNDQTHFKEFLKSRGGPMDWLGFGNGHRSLDAGMTGALRCHPGYESGNTARISLLDNGLDNDWTLKSSKPVGDLKISMNYSHRWETEQGRTYGLLATANYSNSYKSYLDMENSLYGPYDTTNRREVFLRKATDNQYNNDVRLGALLNLTFQPRDTRHRYEWKNIFNQIAKERYSERVGYNAQPDQIHNMEYYYSARSTFQSQLTGKHTLENDRLDWSAGYAYANRHLPDRRLIERTDRTDNQMSIYRISREFTRLDEHILSLNANYLHEFDFNGFTPSLKTGVYGEYRSRAYRTRQFQYAWDPTNSLPAGFLFEEDVTHRVLTDSNYGADKLYMQEEVNFMNNYEGRHTQLSGYAGISLPVAAFTCYAGVRYEYNRQELIMNTRQYEESKHSTYYDYNDLFPSCNITCKINDRHQLRLAYGRSVNRPEFRELSTSVYYDFDLGSNVMGNADLKAAYVDNVDLRYEWYPGSGEQISVAFFYKHFKHPIEWTYTMSGGTDPVYSYINARGANNYGIEVDIRKDLSSMGLKNFSLNFNGAWIKSRVQFDEESNDIDRPMQGQSPYLVNLGLFYNESRRKWNAALLYNRIGKRIIGVGNRYGSSSEGDARNIPNSYEMPRNSLDLSLGKGWGKWEIKAGVRDLLAERIYFKQFEDVVLDGQKQTISEVTRSYKPGRNFHLSIGYQF